MPANPSQSLQKNTKPGSSKVQVTPQSSLGELGQSLLKFIAPVRKVKAHVTEHDYLENAIMDQATVQQSDAISSAGTDNNVASEDNQDTSQAKVLQKGDEGSGYIQVKREPRTIWLDMVAGLIKDCDQKAANTRSALGNTTYRDANKNNSELKRKTIGRIINVVTEDNSDQPEVESTPAKQNSGSAKNSEQERKLSNQYEIDGKPKRKSAA